MLTISYCQGRVNCAILHVTHSIQTLVIFRLWPGCGVPLPQVIITPYVTDLWTSQVRRQYNLFTLNADRVYTPQVLGHLGPARYGQSSSLAPR